MNRLPDDPKLAEKVPDILKVHNGMFHDLARSDDPAIKCENIINLVNNLKETMEKIGMLDYPVNPKMRDPTMAAFLNYQLLGANKAMNMYSRGNIGYAIEIANTVLSEVLFLVYDKRFCKEESTQLFTRDKKDGG